MENPIFRVFLISFAGIAVCAYIMLQVKDEIHTIAQALNDNTIATEAIFKKVDADEKERKALLKLRKNLEIWKDTQCIACHNTIDMALPMRNITIPNAILIVRQGTERTISLGMPLFAKKGKKDEAVISDSDLEIKLQLLYIKELLE